MNPGADAVSARAAAEASSPAEAAGAGAKAAAGVGGAAEAAAAAAAAAAAVTDALNSWVAGVTLVTVADGRDDIGTTVSAFCPVSSDPPLVLVSLMAGSYLAEVFGREDSPVTAFAVVLLTAGQRMLSGRFAAGGRPGARLMLGDVPHRRGAFSGALVVEGGLAALECSAEQVRPAGDHLLVIARVTGVPYVTDTGEPLIRFRRQYLASRL